jgi:hypothetical protein
MATPFCSMDPGKFSSTSPLFTAHSHPRVHFFLLSNMWV